MGYLMRPFRYDIKRTRFTILNLQGQLKNKAINFKVHQKVYPEKNV